MARGTNNNKPGPERGIIAISIGSGDSHMSAQHNMNRHIHDSDTCEGLMFEIETFIKEVLWNELGMVSGGN